MRKKKMSFETLELFLAAVAVLYPFDKLAPGVTVAWLPDGLNRKTPEVGCYYASLRRYSDRNPNLDAEVIGKATGATLGEALKELMDRWLAKSEAALKFQMAMVPAIRVRKRVRRG